MRWAKLVPSVLMLKLVLLYGNSFDFFRLWRGVLYLSVALMKFQSTYISMTMNELQKYSFVCSKFLCFYKMSLNSESSMHFSRRPNPALHFELCRKLIIIKSTVWQIFQRLCTVNNMLSSCTSVVCSFANISHDTGFIELPKLRSGSILDNCPINAFSTLSQAYFETQ